MKFLLDTNSCIDFLLARSDVLARKMSKRRALLAVSAVTAAELEVGSQRSGDPTGDARRVAEFLTLIEVLPFDRAAASAYGTLIKTVAIRRSSFDRLIAAHALSVDRALVTRNVRDFEDVSGLRIEDWTK